MTRIHSKIEQLDGNCNHHEDKKYVGSKHYCKKGWLGGEYQSFIDAYDVIEESDIHDDEKKIEHEKLLEARKIALGDSYTYFPPWIKA